MFRKLIVAFAVILLGATVTVAAAAIASSYYGKRGGAELSGAHQEAAELDEKERCRGEDRHANDQGREAVRRRQG